MEHKVHIMQADSPRIDRALTDTFPPHSRSYFQQLISDDCVSLNGTIVKKSSLPVKSGDEISVIFPAVRLPGALPLPAEDMGVRVLYEHEDFLIVYKPASLLVHAPNDHDHTVTLVDWLIHFFKELETVGATDRPRIVHRLDKDTSGILVIPRNNRAHAYFSELFHNRLIEKTYLAVVTGHPDSEGSIDYTIGRDHRHKHKMAHNIAQGRTALTHYKVRDYHAQTALLELKPVTGRTHQIRVHCAAIGHPIIADATYGTAHPALKRQALHAHQLSFTYKGRYYSFWHDMPQDMRAMLEEAGQRP